MNAPEASSKATAGLTPRGGWLPRPLWLFVGTAAFAILGLGLRFAWTIYRQQAAIEMVERLHGGVATRPVGPKWLHEWLGDQWPDPLEVVTHIHLDGSGATDADLSHLAGLTSLEGLSLDHTHVTDSGLKHFRGLSSLNVLSLYGTQVTDAGLVDLRGHTRLQWLSLGGTKVTRPGIEQLRQALPGTRIQP